MPRVLIQLLNMREIATSGIVFTRQMIPRLIAELGPENVTLLADAVARRHLPDLACTWDLRSVPDIRLAKNLALRQALPEAIRSARAEIVYVPEGPLIGARVDVPVVSALHSHLNFSGPQGMWLPRRLYWLLWANRAYRRDCERAQALIAPTRAFADEYVSFVPEAAGRLRVVSHGVSPAFSPGAMRLGARAAILCVGNDMAYKNLVGALRIFARVAPDVPHELRIVGVSGPQLARLAAEAGPAALPVLSRVRALGRLDESALLDEYRSASALLFPSRVESFGLPVAEAMACGVPVICSDLPALREVAAGAAEHADPEDVIAFAAILRGVLLSGEWRERLRQAGLERARAFSWDRAAADMANLLRDVAAGRGMASCERGIA